MDHSVVSEPAAPPPTNLLDLASSCFVGDIDAAAGLLVEHALAGRGGCVCLCNVHVLTEALHDPRVRRVVSSAALRFPDGEPVAWLLRRMGYTNARRIGGPDLLPRVLDLGRERGLRHVMVGTTEANLARLRTAIIETFPGADVVGSYAPPFADEPDVSRELIELVQSAGAHLVWVSLGAPKQELWIGRAAPAVPNATLVGVGAAFDFLAGNKHRAPALLQRLGLEWLHRMGSEPRRLTSRYVRSNSEFIGRTGFELARRRLRAR